MGGGGVRGGLKLFILEGRGQSLGCPPPPYWTALNYKFADIEDCVGVKQFNGHRQVRILGMVR